jgi:hypothetical protein
MYQYNTTQGPIILRSYGRNIQNAVNAITQLPDENTKKTCIEEVFSIMRIINRNVRSENKESRKLWDDLVIMSKTDLKNYSPFPEPIFFNDKPEKLPYKTNSIRFKNYGYNLQAFIEMIPTLTTKEAQQEVLIRLINLMRKSSRFWNKQNKNTNNFAQDIKILIQDKKLLVSLEEIEAQMNNQTN